jgi:preprotein translocase subunit SecA
MRSFFSRILGDATDKEIRGFDPIVREISDLEPRMQELSQDELRQLIGEIRADYQTEDDLDEALPQVFAAVREASRRTRGQRPFDVQMMGAVALHEGKIAEMKTGEGKTLTAAMALSLNALTGKGAHLVTPNDYLVKVGTQTMGVIYHYLALSLVVASQHVAAFFSLITDPLQFAGKARTSPVGASLCFMPALVTAGTLTWPA